MKKILLLIFLQFNMFAIGFVDKNFVANITEISKNKTKEYNINYTKDKVVLEVLKPELNKGEIYTYINKKKYIYYSSLNQTVEQSLSAVEGDLVLILKEMQKIKENKDVVIANKKYIISNNNIMKIIGDGFVVRFDYNKNNMPTKIRFISDNGNVEYIWKY